jgi:malate dehydrogenase (oxaloacetate-decarboxylating)
MKLAAAEAIAGVVPEEEVSEDYVIPSVFDQRVAPAVAETVAEAGKRSGMAREPDQREEIDAAAVLGDGYKRGPSRTIPS